MNMQKKRAWLIWSFMIISVSMVSGKSLPNAGLAAGIGLPKIPLTHFRMPVSLTGKGFLDWQWHSRFGSHMDIGALTTFSLGTTDGRNGKLRFDLIWTTLNLTYRLRGDFRNTSHLVMGGGMYFLSQKFDDDTDSRKTPGLDIGLTNLRQGRGIAMYWGLRWHLLFNPDPKPQVAILTFGLLL